MTTTPQNAVADRVKRIPARRMLEYATRFGTTTQDLMTDAVMALVVIANEEHLARHGSQGLERYLDMGFVELSEHVAEAMGLTANDEDAVEGATFPDPDSAGGVVAGGVVADGRGAGLRAEPGADLPVDGRPAV